MGDSSGLLDLIIISKIVVTISVIWLILIIVNNIQERKKRRKQIKNEHKIISVIKRGVRSQA